MATTTRAERPARAGRRGAVAAGTTLLVLLTASPALQAQAWRFEPAVKVTAVATDNVGLSSTQEQSDVVVVTTPSLRVQGRGPRYEVTGALAADAVQYLGRTRGDRLFPQTTLDLRSQPVERLFFLDAQASARTTTSDPFGDLGDGPTVLNRSRVLRGSLSPRLERELSPTTRFSLRSDHAWSRGFGSQTAPSSNDAYVEGQAGLYELKPLPMGLRLSYDRQMTRYKSQPDNELEFRTARAALLYSPDPELTLGLTVGRDEGRYTTNTLRDTLRGASLRWVPSERTRLEMQAERRFFGNGWDATLSHRSPFVAINARVQRSVSTYASRLGVLSAGTDVAGLLDAMLTTRVPDPNQRSQLVQDIIAQRGLPDSLSSAIDLYSGGAQVTQGGTLGLSWMGPRNVLTSQVYALRTRDLRGPDDVLLVSADSRQRGASVGLSHRLTPQLSAEAAVTFARVRGEGSNLGRNTRNLGWRIGATQALSLRTSATAGLRFQTVHSDTPGGLTSDGTRFAANSSKAEATSLSVGVLHRF